MNNCQRKAFRDFAFRRNRKFMMRSCFRTRNLRTRQTAQLAARSSWSFYLVAAECQMLTREVSER